jgi:hypothetical protein
MAPFPSLFTSFCRPSSSVCAVVLQDGPCSCRRKGTLLSSRPVLESMHTGVLVTQEVGVSV